MATHQISILQNATPDTSGFVVPALASELTASALFDHFTWAFQDSSNTDIELYGSFVVPQDYSTNPSVRILAACDTSSASTRWQFSYDAIAAGEPAVITATPDQTAEATGVFDATAKDLSSFEITLTAGNFAAGDLVSFHLMREQSDTTNDTFAGTAYVFDLVFEYDTA